MKLLISTKINLIIVISIVLVGSTALFFSVRSIRNGGKHAVEKFRSTVIDQKKEQIKDLINSAFTIAKERHDASKDLGNIKKEYGDYVKGAVNQAMHVLEASGEMKGTLNERQEYAKKVIEKMRWGRNGDEYFWIQDNVAKMIMHPIKPSLNGQNMLGFKDPDGKLFFKEMVDVINSSGAGFVDYKWPKPGFDKPVDKISYVKLFKPWGWVIGGGVYLENTEKEMQERALQSIGSMRYGKDKTGYFFIYNSRGVCILLPPKPEREGKSFYDAKDSKGNFFIKDLIKAGDSGLEGDYHTYYFPKPGSDIPVPKLSFTRKLAGWDWYIGTGTYTDDVDKSIKNEISDMEDKIAFDVLTIISAIFIMMILSLSVSYIVVRKGVVGPIREIIELLKDIAEGEGDLTRRIVTKSKDEMMELGNWFNKFVENIREMINRVKSDSTTLSKTSKILSDVSVKLNQDTQNSSERSGAVACAAEDMSNTMNSASATMEGAFYSINMVSSAAEEMSSTIGEIAKSSEKARAIAVNAVKQTDNASNQVNELGAAANDIFKVVETITDISEQVNLLALNATIEAARAGNAGKGFAVVANEIKGLANQTAMATSEIKERVNGIQNSTEGTVGEILNISKVVNEINEIISTIATAVEQQSATTREIAENISQASSGINEAKESVTMGSVKAQDVSKDIAEVNDSLFRITDASNRVKDNSVELSELSGDLTMLMNKFKTS